VRPRLVIATLAISILFLLFMDTEKPLPIVPPELIAVWKSAHPRYADRFFQLMTDTIVLGPGDGVKQPFRIWRVEKSADEHGTLYAITYLNHREEVAEDTLTFYSSFVGRQQTIRFKNQMNVVWTKENPLP
jgi:hypothetical protein